MGTGESLLPKSLRRKTSWGELSLDKREKIATYLVVGAFFPPPPPSSKSASAKGIFGAHKTRRRRAARALLTEESAPLLDAAISALVARKNLTDAKALRKLIRPIAQMWRPGLIEKLLRQASLKVYNEMKPIESWGELVNLYLIAVALIRQRHEHARSSDIKDAGSRRADWLVRQTYPRNCEYAYGPSQLGKFIGTRRVVWPLICALLYQYARTYNIDLTKPKQPLHQLLPAQTPSARDLINGILKEPAVVFSAAKYFEEQLCRPSSLPEQLTPPLTAADCTSLPSFDDLKIDFKVPAAFTHLSPSEFELARKYRNWMYKRIVR